MQAIETASLTMGTAAACDALGVAPATVYRQRQPAAPVAARPAPPRALAPSERQGVLDMLHSERFLDQAPAQVHATLLLPRWQNDPPARPSGRHPSIQSARRN